ncbi:hypothetical protein Tco_1221371 [Tanacetum coccineum]
MVLLPPWIEIRRDLERDVSYGITDTWEEMVVDMPGAPATDDTELGQRMNKLATQVRHVNRLSDRWWPVGSTCCLGIGYGIAYPGGSIAVKDHRVTGNRQQETDTVDRGPEIDEDTTDTVDSTSEPTGTR